MAMSCSVMRCKYESAHVQLASFLSIEDIFGMVYKSKSCHLLFDNVWLINSVISVWASDFLTHLLMKGIKQRMKLNVIRSRARTGNHVCVNILN